MASSTLRKAILVTWEWAGENAHHDTKIAAILPPDVKSNTLRVTLETLHDYFNSTNAEMAYYAADNIHRPYTSKRNTAPNGYWRIICGHQPYLEARLVRNLSVVTNQDTQQGTYTETVTWEEQTSKGAWEQVSYTQLAHARWPRQADD